MAARLGPRVVEVRDRRTDAQVRAFIRSSIRSHGAMSATALLRLYRASGFRCEQKRFRGLFGRSLSRDALTPSTVHRLHCAPSSAACQAPAVLFALTGRQLWDVATISPDWSRRIRGPDWLSARRDSQACPRYRGLLGYWTGSRSELAGRRADVRCSLHANSRRSRALPHPGS